MNASIRKVVSRRVAPRARGRNSAATKSAILAAAERSLVEGGPEAIRLQKIAADAGISHPAILHHFGSREGLIEAMVVSGLARLEAQFIEGWPSLKEPDIEGVLERFYAIAEGRGIARTLAWLILSKQSLGANWPGILRRAAERMHAGRVRRAQREGRPPPDLQETQFAASFLAITVLGDSLFGRPIRIAMGLRSRGDDAKFRRWLIKIIERMEHRKLPRA